MFRQRRKNELSIKADEKKIAEEKEKHIKQIERSDIALYCFVVRDNDGQLKNISRKIMAQMLKNLSEQYEIHAYGQE